MKLLLILLPIMLISCGPQSNKSKKNFPTVEELIAEEGTPDSISNNEIDKKSKMYNYNKTSFQVKDEQVHMKFQQPKESERSIQYWRHLFKDDQSKISIYEETKHTKSFKLVNSTKGITLVFEESGRVLRIAKDLEVKGE